MKKTTRRLGALVLTLAMVLGLLCGDAWAATSGKCGKQVTWKLSGSTLTVSGKGPMYDYDNDAPTASEPATPWRHLRNKVRRIVIQPGVTRIGRYAFDGCERVSAVSLPRTVRAIGRIAFSSCGSLERIVLPEAVKSVGDSVFFDWDDASDTERSALKVISFKGNAPALCDSNQAGDYGTFDSVVATAYYPAGNRTWTRAKQKNYGGKITWKKWNPYTTALTRVTPGKRAAVVKWKKDTRATGYQIQYAANREFSKAKITTVKGAKKTSVTLKKLAGKKKYYFRVRTYKVDARKKYFSAWSGAKAAKVRK